MASREVSAADETVFWNKDSPERLIDYIHPLLGDC